jgi:drug/metabolite transporter (DMT)-like permease
VSLIGYLVPLVALTGGILILGEQLEPGIAIGGLLIFAGMILTDRAGRAMKPVPLEPSLFDDHLPATRDE